MDEHKLKRLKTSTSCDELSNQNKEILNKIQELINLTKNNQSSNQNGSTATIIQSSNNILILKHSTKDKLISCLNQSNSFLNGKLIKDEIKEKRILEEIRDCVFDLIELPLRLGNATNNSTNDLILTICIDTRAKLINNLINNRNYTIVYANSIPEQIKTSLTDENNKMINLLQNLARSTNFRKVVNKLNSPNEELVQKEENDLTKGNFFKNMIKLKYSELTFVFLKIDDSSDDDKSIKGMNSEISKLKFKIDAAFKSDSKSNDAKGKILIFKYYLINGRI